MADSVLACSVCGTPLQFKGDWCPKCHPLPLFERLPAEMSEITHDGITHPVCLGPFPEPKITTSTDGRWQVVDFGETIAGAERGATFIVPK
jgi:hypothetical protein